MKDTKFKRPDGTVDHWYEKDGKVYCHWGKEDITFDMGTVEDWQRSVPTTPIMFKR